MMTDRGGARRPAAPHVMRAARAGAAALAATLLLAVAAVARSDRSPGAAADGFQYQQLRHGGRDYQVVRADLRQVQLRLYWRDPAGRPYGSLGGLQRALEARGERLLAATNAGIFYRSGEPAGLLVERGRTLRPLNRAAHPPPGEGEGNFFAQPNGVFYLSADGSAHIVATAAAVRRLPAMREATQSGPLLLAAGRPHPLRGDPRVTRNAVAVCGPREVALVFAPRGASIRELALFIRDGLRCPDALYLDGGISGLLVPGEGVEEDGDYAALIGVTARGPGARGSTR